MLKAFALALVVAVLVVGGLTWYGTRTGIETHQVPGQEQPQALEPAKRSGG
jgi:hypothetical protein